MAGVPTAPLNAVWPSGARRLEPVETPLDAIRPTPYGPVRGYRSGAVYVFKGIPYGADTGGSNRFRLPRKPEGWTQPRLAINYGPACPQTQMGGYNPLLQFVGFPDDRQQGEDCLNLNVWTPTTDHAAKLPVLVWLHGGGFFSGSSREQTVYDGENLARRGAVVVSINHRLGPLGFLDLSQSGPEFARSGNVGMLDIVFALQWVHEAISQFGGDPDRVTIFGQSGGGAKVSTLLAMPGARGLFHRAVVMSGSPARFKQKAVAAKVAESMFDNAGVARNDAGALQRMDIAALLRASTKMEERARAEAKGPTPLTWQPILDGDVLTHDWSTGAPPPARGIPLIVGSARDEFRDFHRTVTKADLEAALRPAFSDQTERLIDSLLSLASDASPASLLAMASAMTWRQSAVEQAIKQSASGADVFCYLYALPSPLFDGAIGAPHGSDIAPFFDNVERSPGLTGLRPEAYHLADLMSGALVAFAETGSPDRKALPWTRFQPDRINTMVFDALPRMVNDPAGAAREIVAAASPWSPWG